MSRHETENEDEDEGAEKRKTPTVKKTRLGGLKKRRIMKRTARPIRPAVHRGGYDQGFDKGYDKGYVEGFDKGFEDGFDHTYSVS
ncbi:Yae1 family protein [Paenibacillus hexagrammi]|uniref:Essential protein Yae1 N-terminal domain-containing protein n=1 Tax=Paenibacillus hexagrammi TaxID=2908839 RepID=A0ABY3SDL1_9BACL|nr:Yae1 family protein [Paenibacillus sp. YPD9-1]UJF32073.1 hypothetical protein L0M14_20390 [Paenibacillus sp. YPD9-1]